MKGVINANSDTVAGYLFRAIETNIQEISNQTGIPADELTSRVGSLFPDSGRRTSLPVPGVRKKTPQKPSKLRSKVEVGERTSKSGTSGRVKHKISPEGRKRMAEAQQKRWENIRAAREAANNSVGEEAHG